jgi:hypothetical protein
MKISAGLFHNKNNSIQFFIIYVPSQQLQGQLYTQHSVGPDNNNNIKNINNNNNNNNNNNYNNDNNNILST